MKKLLFLCTLLAATYTSSSQTFSVHINDYPTLESLVTNQLPHAMLLASCSGTFYSLANPHGDQVQITPAKPETPRPATNAIGYWDSPIMNFLGRQKMKAATEQEAVGIVRFYHSLSQGTQFVQKKLYHARHFDDCWVVEVDHNFTNQPGNIQAILPFELKVDAASSVVQFRERCYRYPGSAAVYTNTLASVYEREMKANGGVDYPEAAERELQTAWKIEQSPSATSPKNQNH